MLVCNADFIGLEKANPASVLASFGQRLRPVRGSIVGFVKLAHGKRALSRNDAVGFGDRVRLARTGRRLADQIERAETTPNGSLSAGAGAIGGTPLAATETVAIPIWN